MQKYFLLLCLSVLLIGCGEFSYKRGATGKDLADTKKLCQSESLKGDIEVNECLKKNGWTVHQLNDMDLFAVASVSSNRQNGTKDDLPTLVKEAETAIQTENSVQPTTPATQQAGETKTVAPTKAVVKSANPLDTYSISSWWKMGSNRANLETDMQSCETELGEAHKPDHKNQTFTLGMIVCMHQKGWKALKK